MEKPADFYREKLEMASLEQSRLTSRLKWFGWYRFAAFIGMLLPVVVFGFEWWSGGISLVSLVLFFILVKANVLLEKKKRRAKVIKQLAENELLALKHSFLHFPNGQEFLDVDHFFAYDLDLFGEGSLFQFLNRTATRGGYNRLAEWLLRPLSLRGEIFQRQQAISELAALPEWRLNFLAEGNMFEETEQMNRELQSWSEMELELKHSAKIKWLIWFLPLLTLATIIPGILGASYLWFSLMVLIQWLLLFLFWKRIMQYYKFFGRKSELLSKYVQLLQLIEVASFDSEYLKQLQEQVKPSALLAFRKLKQLIKEFEYRQNMLVGIVLNSILLWDIRCTYQLWKWHNLHHSELSAWLDAVANMDAIISVANYAVNHPAHVLPEIKDEGFVFNAENLGHPLLNPKKRVDNNIQIDGYSKVLIVTGANMAGKSTFLRTVGVNLLLAKIGAPVCASKLTFTPIDIYTNMRTTDSLLKDESYFFAELKRIKTVLDQLKNGHRFFVILDEMLKGTNSIDKLNGSKELIRKLTQFGAVALIATHDLKLSEMEKELHGAVMNKCFEIRIEEEELIFDYKLTAGVTKTMNATFLMKKMGII
jgi:DNA mismatch repair ATPase MutS